MTENQKLLLWRKSSYSAGDDACVEVAPQGHDIAARDSKAIERASVSFGGHQWNALVDFLK